VNSSIAWWPWRRPPAPPTAGASTALTADGGLVYERFAYVVNQSALDSGSWIDDVLAAADDGRWERMQRALDAAARLFTYARKQCAARRHGAAAAAAQSDGRERASPPPAKDERRAPSSVCDAFSALQSVVFRARALRNALICGELIPCAAHDDHSGASAILR
jgi:hypothetical protein